MPSKDTLTIAIEATHPVTLRAAWELARAWREGGGAVRLGIRGGEGPRVRLRLGSLVRPSAVVHFERDFDADRAAAADQLALTIAAWDALGDADPWRDLSSPLPTTARYGEPSPDRPWALSLAFRRVGGEHQLHRIGGAPLPRRADVWWPHVPRIVAAVLGRADCVLGESDPLVYDAVRAGVAVQSGDREIERLRLDGALAGLVPPTLTTDAELWRHVADTAREVHRGGRVPAPLMTPAWVARGRDLMRAYQEAPASKWERLRRRHDKLRRDPRRFFADSRHRPLRALGEVLFPARS
jgi:hypothetical protein